MENIRRWKSGIFSLGCEDPKWEKFYYSASEMQVLDNERHPDEMPGKTVTGKLARFTT